MPVSSVNIQPTLENPLYQASEILQGQHAQSVDSPSNEWEMLALRLSGIACVFFAFSAALKSPVILAIGFVVVLTTALYFLWETIFNPAAEVPQQKSELSAEHLLAAQYAFRQPHAGHNQGAGRGSPSPAGQTQPQHPLRGLGNSGAPSSLPSASQTGAPPRNFAPPAQRTASPPSQPIAGLSLIPGSRTVSAQPVQPVPSQPLQPPVSSTLVPGYRTPSMHATPGGQFLLAGSGHQQQPAQQVSAGFSGGVPAPSFVSGGPLLPTPSSVQSGNALLVPGYRSQPLAALNSGSPSILVPGSRQV
jgi:hypothetical protein